MKKKLLLPLLLSLTLTSCGSKSYEVQDYKKEMAYKDNFKIAQITDIHWGVEMDYNKEIEHLDKMVEAMKSNGTDLIIITGDSFLDANTAMVKKFVSYFDSIGIPWTYTYGNHDLQGSYSYYYINEQILKAKNAVFVDYKDDDLQGFTNFYINLTRDNKTIYRLYIIDSNCYYNEGFTYGYDIIHQDQLDHVKAIDAYENDDAANLAFIHIPLVQYSDAYDGYKDANGNIISDGYDGQGERNETECPGYTDSGAYEVFKSLGFKAVFSGHDHINDYDVNYKNEMILSYGLKATDLVYHEDDLMGYQEITLPADTSTFGLSCIKEVTVKYE